MKKLYRSRNNRSIAGICGGLGELYSIDPNVVRMAVVFCAIAFMFLPVAGAYAVGWYYIPEGPLDE